jgi:hypothetical protein
MNGFFRAQINRDESFFYIFNITMFKAFSTNGISNIGAICNPSFSTEKLVLSDSFTAFE